MKQPKNEMKQDKPVLNQDGKKIDTTDLETRLDLGPGVKENVLTEGNETTTLRSDGHSNICQCCKEPGPATIVMRYLHLCDYCSDACPDNGPCVKGKCKCLGCSDEHKQGELCEDKAAVQLGILGATLKEVCVACAVEICKRMLAGV